MANMAQMILTQLQKRNPQVMQQINQLKNSGVSPQEFLITQLGNSNNNPAINQLIKMAKEGNNEGIENFARDVFKQKGLDFDKEFSNFMNKLGS